MRTFKLDETGDLMFDGLDFVEIADTEEVMQSLKTRLQIRLNEFFLDEFIGLSWENIFSKQFVESNFFADIIDCLSQDDRVRSIDTISYAIEDRKLYTNVYLTLKEGSNINLEGVSIGA